MRNSEETSLQKAVIKLWRMNGVPGSILAHIPNGERRDEITGARLKAMGVMPGMPDLLAGSEKEKIFFVELKKKGGRLSPAQKLVHELLQTIGIEVYVLDELEDVVSLLREKSVLR